MTKFYKEKKVPEKTYSQMRREFYDAYRTKIVPAVKRQDTLRKQKLVLAIILSGLLFICASFLLYIAFAYGGSHSTKENESVVKTSIMVYGLSYFAWYWIKKGFENSIKEKIMPTVCRCFGDMKWSHGSYSFGKFFSTSCVVPNFTSEDYDDIFEGCYKDVKIEIVEAEYDVGSGKNRRTVFNGVILKLDMNKNFIGNTVVKEKQLIDIGNGVQNKNLKQTSLEDVEFNKKYKVFTDDEVEARYLLTPSFMERIKNIQVAFSADRVDCAFYDKYLFIALHTNKDLFSLCSLFKPVDDAKQYFTMYEQIVSIIKLIDHFKLNQKIGL